MAEDTSPVVAVQHGPLRLLTLDRPSKLNAFSSAMLKALDDALCDALADPATRVVAITGAGTKAFCAGNDVERLAGLDSVSAFRDMEAGQRLMLRLHDFAKPTIAMVNGYALGGGFELALACDFVIASSTASFGFPEIKLNTMPGWGGTQLAVAKLGLAVAKRMVLTGLRFDAQDCASFGFIHQLSQPDQLLSDVQAFAATLSGYDGFAYEMCKRSINRANELPLAAGFDLEAAHYAVNFGGEAARAGLEQFTRHRAKRSSATNATGGADS
jgi:enoyl-CoA hydratase/carnithine racemase